MLHESRPSGSWLIFDVRQKTRLPSLMKKTIVLAVYMFALGLAAQAWMSDTLALSKRLAFSGVAVLVIGAGFVLQLKWRSSDAVAFS